MVAPSRGADFASIVSPGIANVYNPDGTELLGTAFPAMIESRYTMALS
jgi:hypothetical protein